ncbi:MAG: HTH domain-containing protein [Oscillospiraceae bacterium]|nr:HTH domain-containing protein [Oscillospiraceae bacterium]
MPEQRKVFLLTEDEISALVLKCTQAGLDTYQKQEADQRRREAKNNDRARRMKDKLQSYRRVKKTIEDEAEYTPQEKYEYRLKFLEDLMGDPNRHSADRTERLLIDREEKRRQDQYSINQIDSALELYRQEVEETGNEEQTRRYRILRMYYIDGQTVTVEEIAELENVSSKTVYRDLNIACEIMYQYVIGM